MVLLFCFLATALAAETVWVEGEDASTHDFSDHSWFNNVNQDLLSPGIPGTTDGDWLIHYQGGDSPSPGQSGYAFEIEEDGPHDLWMRVVTPFTAGWVSVDSSDQIPLYIDENIRETVNLIWPSPYAFGSWCQPGDYCVIHHSIGWVYAGRFDLGVGSHTLTFGVEAHPQWEGGLIVGGLDAFVLVNHDWAPSGSAQPSENNPQSTDWFAFHPKKPPEDWSTSVFAAQLETPAGTRGAVEQHGASLQFEDGTPVKFWGVGGTPPGNSDRMEEQAALLAAMGVNLVRRHPVQSTIGNPIDPEKLDHFDQWFATLKEHGIYSQWSIFYPHRIVEEDGYPRFDELSDGSTSGLVTVFPELQAYEWEYLQPLLDHVNPYTGLKYAEDPALAVIEVRNEDSIFWYAPLNALESSYPQHAAILKADWAIWLTDKYGDDTALETAWGDGVRAADSLSNVDMKIYAAWEMAADGPSLNPLESARMGDWIQFLAERQCEGYQQRKENLRALGYKGTVLSTGWKVGGPAADMANLWTDDCLEMIDRHTYQGGGTSLRGGIITAGEVSQTRATVQPGAGVLEWNHMQVQDKPMQHSEWIASVPTPFKLDSVPTYGLYGMGLYGWDAGLNFTLGDDFSYVGGWPRLSQWAAATPHHLGQYPAVSRAVRHGHLTEGTPAHAERFTHTQLFTGMDERIDYDPWLGAVGPIVKGLDGGTTETVNLEDYRDGDFVLSNTGELAWNTAGWYKVMTEKTQGLVGDVGPATVTLPDVEVELETPFVSLLFTSLDDRPLASSSSILITAMARDKQTGTIYNGDQTQLLSLGGPPLLLEPVIANLTFGGETITAVNILDEHGIVRGSVTDVEGNKVVLDGRWETAWYQVQREVPEDTGDLIAEDDITGNEGCGCAQVSPPSSGVAWLGLGGLLFVLRRRSANHWHKA